MPTSSKSTTAPPASSRGIRAASASSPPSVCSTASKAGSSARRARPSVLHARCSPSGVGARTDQLRRRALVRAAFFAAVERALAPLVRLSLRAVAGRDAAGGRVAGPLAPFLRGAGGGGRTGALFQNFFHA